MKKLTLFFVALFCANVLSAEISAGTRLYLEPNNWVEGSERFAVYFFGNSGEAWVSMNPVSTFFEAVVPSGTWDGFVFVRMWHDNPNNSWGGQVRNQTSNIYDVINNFFRITGWERDDFTGDRINTIPAGTILHLLPNEDWLIDNARFAVFFYEGAQSGDASTWARMTPTGGDGGFYQVEVPTGGNWIGAVYARMDEDDTLEDSFSVRLNQVQDFHHIGHQPLFTQNLCIVAGWWAGRFEQYGINLGSFMASGWTEHRNLERHTPFFPNGIDEVQDVFNVLMVDVKEDKTSFTIFQSDFAVETDQDFNVVADIPAGSIIRAVAHWHPVSERKDNTHTVVLPDGVVIINGVEVGTHENLEFTAIISMPDDDIVTISGKSLTDDEASFLRALSASELRLNIEGIPVPDQITTENIEVTFNLLTNQVTIAEAGDFGSNVNNPKQSNNIVFTVGRTIKIEMENENNRVAIFSSLGQMLHSANTGSTFEFTVNSAGIYLVRVNELNYKVIVR